MENKKESFLIRWLKALDHKLTYDRYSVIKPKPSKVNKNLHGAEGTMNSIARKKGEPRAVIPEIKGKPKA